MIFARRNEPGGRYIVLPRRRGDGKRWTGSWVKAGAKGNRRWGAGSQEGNSQGRKREQKSLISIFIKFCSAVCNVTLSFIFSKTGLYSLKAL